MQVNHNILIQNRAEELGYDLWEHFVIPPFYDRLGLTDARKPQVIIGGRGCGKTMLLRYLSHSTMFSPNREHIPDEAFSHIGLYWRIDTQYASMMTKRDITDEVWLSAFKHLAALFLGREVLGSLYSIARSSSPHLTESDIKQVDFSRLKVFDSRMPNTVEEVTAYLEDLTCDFESWLNNVRKKEIPLFLPGKQFVERMIGEINKKVNKVIHFNYFVYVDEYENLLPYQQKIINTWLKHSEVPLVFNLAMKRNAFAIRETTGEESLSDIHDFRQHDLEAYLLENYDFQVFAAEILSLKFIKAGVTGLAVNPTDLRDPHKLKQRNETAYRDKVISSIENIFPDLTQKELAKEVFNDPVLRDQLKRKIQQALKYKGTDVDADLFLKPMFPEASVITFALLYRKRVTPEDVLSELKKLERGEDNKFTGTTNWIHNNFVGCFLQLYAPLSRPCPFYAGFSTFCHLAHGNIRHLLELCHKSLNIGQYTTNVEIRSLSYKAQAEAASRSSVAFLKEIRSFGRLGNQLHTFVLRLGSIFKQAHQRRTTSESEQSHFSITRGNKLSETNESFLHEAVKWSVLFENKGTKEKGKYQQENIEYVLNPIYAPYFHISYRKKRRIELSSEQITTLIDGSFEEFSRLLQGFAADWGTDSEDFPFTLFNSAENEK